MLRVVNAHFDSIHPLGVEKVQSTAQLVETIKRHSKEKGERECPFFIQMNVASGLRTERWVSLAGDVLLVRTELRAEPIKVPVADCATSRYLGRYINEGRLFYDGLNLELPQDVLVTSSLARSMQVLS